MKSTACAFTGHCLHKFPWKYDEADLRCAALVEQGVTDYYSGGADGVDCWAAQIVLALREKNPALHLHCILPCEGQTNKWNDSAREWYHPILNCGKAIYLGKILRSRY